jgi:hypothetical protein
LLTMGNATDVNPRTAMSIAPTIGFGLAKTSEHTILACGTKKSTAMIRLRRKITSL